jgi:hypothetical protein
MEFLSRALICACRQKLKHTTGKDRLHFEADGGDRRMVRPVDWRAWPGMEGESPASGHLCDEYYRRRNIHYFFPAITFFYSRPFSMVCVDTVPVHERLRKQSV